MKGFFEAFFPNLAASILAVIFGIPIGFWLLHASERAQRRTEQLRLQQGLEVVSQALTFNRERFAEMRSTMTNNQVALEATVDFSAWEAVKSEVIPFLHKPTLQQRLAYHFSRIQGLVKLNDMYLNYSAGIGSALGGSQKTRDALRSYLLQTLSELDSEAAKLIDEIKKLHFND